MRGTDNFDFILDAWALLAHFDNQAGAERVREVLKAAEKKDLKIGLSVINLGEVAYITERERNLAMAQKILAIIHSLAITILPVDETVVMTAAHIKAIHRLSYADAFAAATTILWGGKLLTGDPEFKILEKDEIPVEWLI